MDKFPMDFKTRLRQLICRHETIGQSWMSAGINDKVGLHYVSYKCRCGLEVSRWELDGVDFKKKKIN